MLNFLKKMKLKKKLSEEVRKGQIGVPNAINQLKKEGFRISKFFNLKLRKKQTKFLKEKGFFKKIKEEQEKEKNKVKLEDIEIIKANKDIFNSTYRLLEKGKIDEKQAYRIAKEMGLKKPENWIKNYKNREKWKYELRRMEK